MRRRNRAGPSGAAGLDLPVECHQNGRKLRRRIGVGHAASNGPPVADGGVTDPLDGSGEERIGPSDQLGTFYISVAGHGAHPDAGTVGDEVELADRVDIHEVGRIRQTEVEQRHQALSTGKDLGLIAQLGQLGHGFIHRRHPHVLERRRLHGFPAPKRSLPMPPPLLIDEPNWDGSLRCSPVWYPSRTGQGSPASGSSTSHEASMLTVVACARYESSLCHL